jgi:hypothetical protein
MLVLAASLFLVLQSPLLLPVLGLGGRSSRAILPGFVLVTVVVALAVGQPQLTSSNKSTSYTRLALTKGKPIGIRLQLSRMPRRTNRYPPCSRQAM